MRLPPQHYGPAVGDVSESDVREKTKKKQQQMMTRNDRPNTKNHLLWMLV